MNFLSVIAFPYADIENKIERSNESESESETETESDTEISCLKNFKLFYVHIKDKADLEHPKEDNIIKKISLNFVSVLKKVFWWSVN